MARIKVDISWFRVFSALSLSLIRFLRNAWRHTARLLSTAKGSAVIVKMMAVLLCAGCGESQISDQQAFQDLHPVSGRVTFNGKPIVGGTVRLFPVAAQSAEAKGEVYTGIVAADGSFGLRTFRSAGHGSGVPAGEYRVSFSWSGTPEESAEYSADELPEKLPAKLTRPKTSGFLVTVAAGGTVVPDIDLR